jgi:protease II
VFDDFAAAVRFLIDRKFTSPASLAIMGGSNGGLLMGATMTQHPQLFRAVVSHVGIYDMLRMELYRTAASTRPSRDGDRSGTVPRDVRLIAVHTTSSTARSIRRS